VWKFAAYLHSRVRAPEGEFMVKVGADRLVCRPARVRLTLRAVFKQEEGHSISSTLPHYAAPFCALWQRVSSELLKAEDVCQRQEQIANYFCSAPGAAESELHMSATAFQLPSACFLNTVKNLPFSVIGFLPFGPDIVCE